jgi:hypothetical protein
MNDEIHLSGEIKRKLARIYTHKLAAKTLAREVMAELCIEDIRDDENGWTFLLMIDQNGILPPNSKNYEELLKTFISKKRSGIKNRFEKR